MIQQRPANQNDRAFIYSTILKGLFHGVPLYGEIEKTAFFTNYSKIIDGLLQVADIRVACLVDDPDVIVGYMICRGDVIDWAFTKQAWRGKGVQKLLAGDSIFRVCTHLTPPGNAIRKKYKIEFNPFAL